ncbi:MAG: SCO family protein [Melioribacteraceae bacterium]|nr:SCO family protein [Melioribacteraceae bacterium]MCF8262976.1 SCO family protein [Melioribacteraceae bacterium]MCF8430591.1 SCO family protein [Melioribacteraceae bacterium]
MKKTILIATILIIAVSGFVFTENLFLNGNSNEIIETSEVKNEEPASCCSGEEMEKSEMVYSDNSIYQINSDWKNQFGNAVNIGELSGKTQIVALIFANCTYACPLIVNDMRNIEKNLTDDELQKVQFTLISIDPERDTPEKLKEFALSQNLNLSRWQLLTGKRTDIDDFAALIGFRYKKENDGSFSHSNLINIFNEKGELFHQHQGLNQEISNTILSIKKCINTEV